MVGLGLEVHQGLGRESVKLPFDTPPQTESGRDGSVRCRRTEECTSLYSHKTLYHGVTEVVLHGSGDAGR